MANSNNQKLVNDRVRAAICRTAAFMPTYYGKMLAQRLPIGGCGSVFEGFDSPEQLAAAILGANWEPAEPPAGSAIQGCGYFKTRDIPGGRMGLVRIADLPDDVPIVARDPKGTGMVSMAVQGVRGLEASETWIILGPGDEDGVSGEIVWTFHPGSPVRPSLIEVENVPDGTILTKAEAQALGFDLAKIESPQQERRVYIVVSADYWGGGDWPNAGATIKGVFANLPEADKSFVEEKDVLLAGWGNKMEFVKGCHQQWLGW